MSKTPCKCGNLVRVKARGRTTCPDCGFVVQEAEREPRYIQ